jgi:hypothetical protein
MGSVANERQTPVNQTFGKVFGDGRADDGMPPKAVKDGVAPGRRPTLAGLEREISAYRLRHMLPP